MRRIFFITICLLISSVSFLFSEVRKEEVTYTGGGVTMKGMLAYDAAKQEKRPGVIVIHEWWGHDEYVRKRAQMLAELGYTALAVDMFGDGKQAAHPKDAEQFVTEVMKNHESAKARFLAALQLLQGHKTVDPQRIASIGYCFGGSVSLEMARQGIDLDGVAAFHAGLSTKNPAKPGVVKGKVLVCHGGADQFVPKEEVDAFKKEMEAAKVDYQFKSYEGATHSFTNPAADEYSKKFSMPVAYNATADKQSWEDLKGFFNAIFVK